MRFSAFITHALVFITGLALCAYYFLIYGLPEVKTYVVADPQNIILTQHGDKIPYNELLQQDFLGSLYLRHPAYFYKRDEGYNILRDLANKGYTPAAANLHAYHTIKMRQNALNNEKLLQHYKPAYDWSMVAAKQGDYVPLMSMVSHFDLHTLREDISEELELLDKWAEKSSISGPASIMATYYEKQGDAQKAKHFRDVEQRIVNKPPPAPICSTITPWRGW